MASRAEFESVLSATGEGTVQQFLAQHDELLLKTFCPTGTYLCLPKFAFGLEYVSDFVLVQLWSTTTRLIPIELEPPLDSPFTRAGVFARRLNGAVGQVNDWFSWIRRNDAYFCDSLLRTVQRTNIDAWNTLQHRIHYREVSAKIIVGRRHMLTEADDGRRAAFYLENRSIEIVPYDRLADAIVDE